MGKFKFGKATNQHVKESTIKARCFYLISVQKLYNFSNVYVYYYVAEISKLGWL